MVSCWSSNSSQFYSISNRSTIGVSEWFFEVSAVGKEGVGRRESWQNWDLGGSAECGFASLSRGCEHGDARGPLLRSSLAVDCNELSRKRLSSTNEELCLRLPTSQIPLNSKYFPIIKIITIFFKSSYLGEKLESSLTAAINVGHFLFYYKHKNQNRSHQWWSIGL